MSLPRIKFFVCGQVDSGKSTLIGNLLFKSNTVTKLDSSSSEATKFSDLLDVDQSERDRGITQFSSNNLFVHGSIEFEAIDTPGHLLYIRELINSIASNKGAIGCLIISAIPNDFESMFKNGTTKEDAILMRCSGINHIICLVNKIDKSQANPDVVIKQFDPWISKLGFKTIEYCKISGYQGTNLFERNNKDSMCFIETLIHVNSKIKRIDKEKITKTKSKCKLDFYSFDLDQIVASGFKSIFHIVDSNDKSEVVGEIIGIVFKDTKNKSKPFFKSNENIILYVELEEPVDLFESQRLILRYGMKTIGFGYIMFS